MGITRRSLLQTMGLALAGWGLLPFSAGGVAQAVALPTLRPSGSASGRGGGRKLALLVGINHYSPNAVGCPALQGCQTDVELQRQWLIHRVGFVPDDIVTLLDEQATVAGLQTALETHLLQRVEPNDDVVVHFSGYGSLLRSSDGQTTQRTLVLYDSRVNQDPGGAIAPPADWPESLLWEALSRLPTPRILTVLDTSYYEPSPLTFPPALRHRACTEGIGDAWAPQLQAIAAAWQQQFPLPKASDSTGKLTPKSSLQPGWILQATDLTPIAVELPHSPTAGAFTYALTQQLWSTLPNQSWATVLDNTSNRLRQLVHGLLPLSPLEPRGGLGGGATGLPLGSSVGLSVGSAAGVDGGPAGLAPGMMNLGAGQRSLASLAPWQLRPLPAGGLDGVVMAVASDGTAKVWLGALPAAVLAAWEPGVILQRVVSSGPEAAIVSRLIAPVALLGQAGLEQVERLGQLVQGEAGRAGDEPRGESGAIATDSGNGVSEGALRSWQVVSRTGFVAEVRLSGGLEGDVGEPLQMGQWLQEQVRIVPRQPQLSIALDPRLKRIERVDATSAFASVGKVNVVGMGEAADYMFARLPLLSPTLIAALPNGSPTALPSSGSAYGLLTASQEALSGTVGPGEEAIKTAVQRLQTVLQRLKAGKGLRSLESTSTSLLPLQVSWNRASRDLTSSSLNSGNQTNQRNPGNPLAQFQTRGMRQLRGDAVVPPVLSPSSLRLGERLGLQLDNAGDRPLYVCVIGIDGNGFWQLHPFPVTVDAGPEAQVVPDFFPLLPPRAKLQAEWPLQGAVGFTELAVLAGVGPFTQARRWKAGQMSARLGLGRMAPIADPSPLLTALLTDLQAASADVAKLATPESYALAVDRWALVRWCFEVVA